jgi:hypothetical protein
VRPEWASPTQFNHAIVAIHVSDAVQLPTVIPDSPLGRLLMFDPTDSITPVGDLPANANRIDSAVDATMDADGRVNARIQRQYFGQAGMPLRALEKLRGDDELKRRFERGFARRLGATTLGRVATESHPEDNRFSVELDLAADRFGQSMQGRLLVLRPGMLASGGDYVFTSKQRTSPVKLDSDLRHDLIRVKIPAGFKLDELPAPAKLESPYGTYQATWAAHDAEIVMEQTLEIRDTVAPAADYAQVRDFFDHLAGAETAPVVFVKQ